MGVRHPVYDFTNLHRVRASGKRSMVERIHHIKGIGFATAYLVYRLASYWEKRNLIPELDEDEEV